MRLFVLAAILSITWGQDLEPLDSKTAVKRSYVCPPNFVRLSHRCYFFSKEEATWQEAFFKCRDFYSNLAIIKNSNQDKLIRKTLSRKTLEPLERWLGGRYDWVQMKWIWAASGKPFNYKGFPNNTEDVREIEKLKWHCLIIDPKLQYRWDTRSCFEKKHYICQTKIKTVTNKGRKKLQKQYNVNKFNQLNEIPVPQIPDDLRVNSAIKRRPITFEVEINKELNAYSYRPKPRRRKGKKNKPKHGKGKTYNKLTQNNTETSVVGQHAYLEGPNVVMNDDAFYRRRRNRGKEHEKNNTISLEGIKWKTYREETNTTNPLYPKPIVEEFYYQKPS